VRPRGVSAVTRSPSGAQPYSCGYGRKNNTAIGTIPTNQIAASQGDPASIPRVSRICLITGVTTMPPTESPVDAMANADARLVSNQRVTTVVIGPTPDADQPSAYTA